MKPKICHVLLMIVYFLGMCFIFGSSIFFIIEAMRGGTTFIFRSDFKRFDSLFEHRKMMLYTGVFLVEGLIVLCAMPYLLGRTKQSVLHGRWYFFALFFLTLAFDGLRTWAWWFSWRGMPEQMVTIVLRQVLFMKIVGDVFLFASSLYKRESQNKSIGTITAVLALSTACFVFLVPIDIRSFHIVNFFVFRREFHADNFGIIIAVVAVVNYLYHAFNKEHKEGLELLALVVFVVARNIIFYTASFVLSVSVLMLYCVSVSMYLRNVLKTMGNLKER